MQNLKLKDFFGEVKRYLRVWRKMTANSFMVAFETWQGSVLFLTGKIIRFAFYFVMLYVVVGRTKVLAGYDLSQVLFFYLTFNFVDVSAQLLFREVYRFRPKVISGDLDLILTKPIDPLLRIILGGADILDFFTLIPLAFGVYWAGTMIGGVNMAGVILFLILVANAVFIAYSLHIVVVAICVLTTQVDHAIMIYRDLTAMARVPTDIYNDFIRGFLTFGLPVIVMITYPAKAVMGFLSVWGVVYSFLVSTIIYFLARWFWGYSLRKYVSSGS